MNRAMFSIVLLALLAQSSIAETVDETMTTRDFDRLYRAAVDIAMTCYGDPGNAVGIVGDSDGSILKELRSRHFIPVVLVNGSRNDDWNGASSHKLRVFIVAVDSPMHLHNVLSALKHCIWWNEDANFLIVDTRTELSLQCAQPENYMIFTTHQFTMLNVQFICRHRRQQSESIIIWNSNPFVHQASEVWEFVRDYDFETGRDQRNGYLFSRSYRERGQSCESINFAKTGKVGDYPLRFVSHMPPEYFERDREAYEVLLEDLEGPNKILFKWLIDDYLWFMDNIVIATNATAVVIDVQRWWSPSSAEHGILLQPDFFSCRPKDFELYFKDRYDGMIVRLNQSPILALTQHTPHKSQLDKILSVIDRESRIGVWVVSLITFLFFKFLGQSVIPALLNLVRLTCGTGLTTLPQNVAPTIYLTSLFMFVVTLQAIYMGNLATLLTTTVSYPNVQTKEHIPKLGYKICNEKDRLVTLVADPILDGCVVKIPDSQECIDYVLRDPSAVCVMDHMNAIYRAAKHKLHLSRDPMLNEYMVQRRIEEVLTILFEAGLYHPALDKLRLEFVDDDEVKKNTERRVMTLEDLSFAFVILGGGLLASVICFIGEIVVCRIRSKYAKRRDWGRVRPAWGVTAKKCSWFQSLNCRFNLRHLYSNHR